MAVFAFDLLYLNGEALVRKPFKERRQLLQDHFHSVEGEFHFAKSADPETMEDTFPNFCLFLIGIGGLSYIMAICQLFVKPV